MPVASLSLNRVAGRRGKIAVSQVGVEPRLTQPLRHFDGRGDRAVASSCASERNGHVTFARGPVAGNPVDEKRFDAGHRLAPGRVLAEIVADRLIDAGQRAKPVDPVRVRQEAQVEDQVGGPRNAPREGEGGDGQHRLVGVAAEAPPQLIAKLARRQVRGIDQTPGVTAFLENLALLGEPFQFGIDDAKEFFAAGGLTVMSRTASQNAGSLDHPIFSRYRFHTIRF